jgi:hypothetical protein
MNTKTILTFVTLAAALAVLITPSLKAAAVPPPPNAVCEKIERLQKV